MKLIRLSEDNLEKIDAQLPTREEKRKVRQIMQADRRQEVKNFFCIGYVFLDERIHDTWMTVPWSHLVSKFEFETPKNDGEWFEAKRK
jgi:hypothetical protein